METYLKFIGLELHMAFCLNNYGLFKVRIKGAFCCVIDCLGGFLFSLLLFLIKFSFLFGGCVLVLLVL